VADGLKRVALAGPGGPSPAAAAVDDAESRRVSLDFVAADINDVLKALSLQSGINIVTGNDVKGNITVSLKRVSMTEALDMVTRLSGYTYAKFGPAFVVGTPSSVGAITARSEKPVENVTEFIPYRYTSSANLYRVLGDKFPGLKLPEADKNDLPSQPKLLVLTDSPKRVAEVRELVEKMEQVASVPTQGAVTEVYQVKYASPADLVSLLSRLVPTVSVQPGPTQGFHPEALGGSASFSSGGSYGSPPSNGGASTGGSMGGTSGGSGTGGNTTHLPMTLLLTGAPADLARAKEVLGEIDVRVPQMVYEAKVIDINDTDSQDLGFRYDFSQTAYIGENNSTGTAGTVGPGAAAGAAR
jgi:type II secretory pathway component GspD/PulD (secretin)